MNGPIGQERRYCLDARVRESSGVSIVEGRYNMIVNHLLSHCPTYPTLQGVIVLIISRCTQTHDLEMLLVN